MDSEERSRESRQSRNYRSDLAEKRFASEGIQFVRCDTNTDKNITPNNNAAKPPRAAWNHTVTMFDGTAAGSSGGDTMYNRAVYLNGNSLTTTATADSPGEMVQNASTLYLGNKSGSAAESSIFSVTEVSSVVSTIPFCSCAKTVHSGVNARITDKDNEQKL